MERSGPITITLEPWEYEHAANIGIRRYTANWSKTNASWYDANRMEDERTAQVASCVAELAVAKHTNRYWGGHVWHHSEHHTYRDVPDVGSNIEVRRVRKPAAKAAVRAHQLGHGLVLWVAYPVPPEFREVHLLGWLPYDTAWELATPAAYDKKGTTRVIDPSHLRTELPQDRWQVAA